MAINVNDVSKFRFIAHKVMPLVFDESLSYYEFLCKVLQKLNEVIDNEDNQNQVLQQFDTEITRWEDETDLKYQQFVAQVDQAIADFEEAEVAARGLFEESVIGRQTEFEGEISGQQEQFEEQINEDFQDFFDHYLQTLGVVQTTGTSTTDVMSQKAVTDELNKTANKYRSVPIYAPNDFTWQNNPLTGKIYNDYKGNVTVDYDVSENDVSENGVTYYVNYPTGNDSNTGLDAEHPLKTMAAAYNKSDVSCIMLAGGIIPSTSSLFQTPIQKDIAIKASEDNPAYVCTSVTRTFTEISGHTGCYQNSIGNTRGIIDHAVKNKAGDDLQYTMVNSVDDVYATAGSWYHSSGVLYIHTADNREPDGNIIVLRNGDNLKITASATVYLENVKFYGGLSPLIAQAPTGGVIKIYAKNCDFFYSDYSTTQYDLVMLEGVTEAIFQNCRAKYGNKDGFNYHKGTANIIPKAIEINCEGAFCGNSNDSDDQGSTMHDTGKIIRVNGMYHDTYGSCIADNTAGTEAWNVGCVCYNSFGEGGQGANFFVYDDVKMWNDSCVGFGSTYNLAIHNATAVMGIRNCKFTGTLTPAGHEDRVTYY